MEFKSERQLRKNQMLNFNQQKEDFENHQKAANRKNSLNENELTSCHETSPLKFRKVAQTPNPGVEGLHNNIGYSKLIEDSTKIYEEAIKQQKKILESKNSVKTSISKAFIWLNEKVKQVKQDLENNVENYYDCVFATFSANNARLKSILTEIKDLKETLEKSQSHSLKHIFDQKKLILMQEINNFDSNICKSIEQKPVFNWAIDRSIINFCELPFFENEKQSNIITDNLYYRKMSRPITSSNKNMTSSDLSEKQVYPKIKMQLRNPRLKNNQERTRHPTEPSPNMSEISNIMLEELDGNLLTSKKEVSKSSLSCLSSPISTPRGASKYRSFIKNYNEDNVERKFSFTAFEKKKRKATNLDFSREQITDSILLKEVLPKINLNDDLKIINLADNLLSDKGVKHLLKHIKNMAVEEIVLINNDISPSTLDYLLSFTKYNSSMKIVRLLLEGFEKTPKLENKINTLREKGIHIIY